MDELVTKLEKCFPMTLEYGRSRAYNAARSASTFGNIAALRTDNSKESIDGQ
jgi:hypothetical protein